MFTGIVQRMGRIAELDLKEEWGRIGVDAGACLVDAEAFAVHEHFGPIGVGREPGPRPTTCFSILHSNMKPPPISIPAFIGR